jgi:anti-anti-sigma factor
MMQDLARIPLMAASIRNPVDIDPHQLVHQVIDGVHVISFHRDENGQVSTEFANRFFAGDLLTTTMDMNILVFDLSGVETLNSSALGPLVQKLRDVQERHGRLALACVHSPALREIFALTRFDKVFRIYPTRADAVRALSGTSSASAT